MIIGHMSFMAAIMAAASGSPAMGRPLTLIAERSDGSVRLSVKGFSATACEARYELDVESGKPGRSNRSRQGGVARLAAGKAVTIATVTIGNADSDDWSARLSVRGCGTSPYDVLANPTSVAT